MVLEGPRSTGKKYRSDNPTDMSIFAHFGASIRSAPRAAGVEHLTETSVQVKVEGVTAPGEQWRVAGELRRRLKQAFDAEGIGIKS